jgi:hypothetical protein
MTGPTPQLNQSPYLVTSRQFPFDDVELPRLLNKSYFETANAVNARTIGIYDKFQIATGNRYFNTGDPTNRLQSFRQVYTIAALPAAGTATIPSNIAIDNNTQFVQIYGTVQNGSISVGFTDWHMGALNDAPYLKMNEATGNIEIITTSGNWTTYSGIITLEYILNN